MLKLNSETKFCIVKCTLHFVCSNLQLQLCSVHHPTKLGVHTTNTSRFSQITIPECFVLQHLRRSLKNEDPFELRFDNGSANFFHYNFKNKHGMKRCKKILSLSSCVLSILHMASQIRSFVRFKISATITSDK